MPWKQLSSSDQWSLKMPLRCIYMLYPSSQICKLRCRYVKYLARGHTESTHWLLTGVTGRDYSSDSQSLVLSVGWQHWLSEWDNHGWHLQYHDSQLLIAVKQIQNEITHRKMGITQPWKMHPLSSPSKLIRFAKISVHWPVIQTICW